MYKRIVVPLDGSTLAEKALDQAKDLARQNGIPLFLVRAVDPPIPNTVSALGMRPAFGMSDGIFVEEERNAHAYVDRQVDHLKADGLAASGVVVWGNAASAVASTLNDTDCWS
jgi:nucleotide-binding universal stress UspA family protein